MCLGFEKLHQCFFTQAYTAITSSPAPSTPLRVNVLIDGGDGGVERGVGGGDGGGSTGMNGSSNKTSPSSGGVAGGSGKKLKVFSEM